MLLGEKRNWKVQSFHVWSSAKDCQRDSKWILIMIKHCIMSLHMYIGCMQNKESQILWNSAIVQKGWNCWVAEIQRTICPGQERISKLVGRREKKIKYVRGMKRVKWRGSYRWFGVWFIRTPAILFLVGWGTPEYTEKNMKLKTKSHRLMYIRFSCLNLLLWCRCLIAVQFTAKWTSLGQHPIPS